MRYFVQFVIPALIFVTLVYVVGRKRGLQQAGKGAREDEGHFMSNGTFVLCLVVGAAFTVALLFGVAQL